MAQRRAIIGACGTARHPAAGARSPESRFRKAIREVAAVTLLSTLLLSPALAGIADDAGTRGSSFLRVEPGARNAAMGGSYAGVGDDAFSLWGQPAALAEARRPSASFQHNSWIVGMSQEFAGVVYPLERGSVVGVTLNYLDAGNIDRAGEDATGNYVAQAGTFGARDVAVAAHYGRLFRDGKLSAGVAGKIISSQIDDKDALGYAADLGLRYRVTDRLLVGGSVVNLGRGLTFITKRDKLPLTYRVGGSYLFNIGRRSSLLLAADGWKGSDTNWEFSGGAEARIVPAVALRAGYRSANDGMSSGVTGGIGLNFDVSGTEFELDYGYVPFGHLGEAHRASINFRWGGEK